MCKKINKIIIFPDYSSSGLWDYESGASIVINDINGQVNEKARYLLEYMNSLYDKYAWTKKNNSINFTLMEYNIAVYIKKDNPHLTVLIYDNREKGLLLENFLNRNCYKHNIHHYEIYETDEIR